MVNGIVYDDVAVNFPSTKGIEGSLPSAITGSTEYRHSSVLYLADAVCQYVGSRKYGQNIIKDPDKLRVMAILIDGNTGNVCNAATSGYSKDAALYDGLSGIESPESEIPETEVVSVEYFTIDGIRIESMPDRGVIIVVKHHSDGSVSTEKRIL